ncbi:type VI secretion protein [Sphingomonas yunnanensis]|uniref:type VI secretion protein n=1 Tax=Sphingomonas yunnanensis TaxID=310400 RepID=UPI001CA7B37E|nr:type VI secretion protein [Sphingomonas yunnanensis]MBY9063685.1 type VI secretion protein [Sphingomonas yunnanensis]
MRPLWTAIATGAVVVAVPVSAQSGGGAQRVLDGFAACRAIPDPGERLACYDKASAALEQAVKQNDVRIVDRAEVRRARRSLFGLNLPDLGLLGGATDRGEADQRETFSEINTTVRSARAGGNGRAEITLADEGGPVWQTTDPMPFPPKAGAKVRIRKGAIGAFFLNVDGRSYRAVRLR